MNLWIFFSYWLFKFKFWLNWILQQKIMNLVILTQLKKYIIHRYLKLFTTVFIIVITIHFFLAYCRPVAASATHLHASKGLASCGPSLVLRSLRWSFLSRSIHSFLGRPLGLFLTGLHIVILRNVWLYISISLMSTTICML